MLARGAAEIEHDSVAQVVQAIVDQGCRHKEEEGEEDEEDEEEEEEEDEEEGLLATGLVGKPSI